MDKISILNYSLFYFEAKAIKLALQLSPYLFFFAVINNFLRMIRLLYCTVRYVIREAKTFPERNSIIHCFSSSKLKTIPLL